ncbi:S phase cyclin A-associated protein in the endoplasmic reticulum-like isoform X2 [Babylonia areolata]|uniref:S phase cyclin A-associated protein in the endoplasmic reticulum-like isoform X2 n=1 Tax=Babylonia areolata TaxID=304850 RepID=UPI003FD1A6A5
MNESRRKRHTTSAKSRSDYSDHHQRSGPQSSGAQRPKNLHANTQRMNSMDHVRKIVQEEGRTARNLVQYSVPLEDEENTGRPSRQWVKNRHRPERAGSQSGSGKTPPPEHRQRHRSMSELTKSPCSEHGPKKNSVDLRARYWKFLFDNFQRAVDAIYQTCEQDESVVECKEVIMMLEQSTKDFKSLIERLHVMRAFEDAAKDGDRPTSIAWEVRKMSPGKHASASPGPVPHLAFSVDMTHAQVKPTNSWADKVRGARALTFNGPTSPRGPLYSNATGSKTAEGGKGTAPTEPKKNGPASNEELKEPEVEDEEGWETVQRGGRLKSRQSPSQKSLENLSEAGMGGKKQIIRSMSVPDSSAAPPKDKRAFPNNHRGNRGDKNRAASHQHLPVTRERLDSKGSEKENINRSQKPVTMADTKREVQVEKVKRDIFGTKDKGHTGAWGKKIGTGDSENVVGREKTKEEVNGVETVTGKPSDEENLATQLKDKLAVVLAEEDALSTELEEQQQEALASAIEEEETWLQALAKEQSSNIDIPTDTDSELGTTASSLEGSNPVADWDAVVAAHDVEIASRDGKSWGEMVEEAEARTPGHGVHMHEKLSSPSRKRSPTESRRRHEEKQAKAQELREKLLQEKAERLRELSKKVEEVRAIKEDLMNQTRLTVEQKLQRAEEKRLLHLKETAQKAHEERAKANEIAFINTLEAQNKRHDIMSKHQESEARLQDLIEERQRKYEEKQAKEAAVEERRRALEAVRLAKLQDMQERRKQRDARIQQQQLEKEKERQEAILAKEKDREERLAALSAQQQAQKEELQKKIQQKQDETTQRHEEYLRQIREKAFEMSILRHSTEDHNDAPEPTPYDKNKLCVICNVLIPSEVYLLSHLRGKKHQQALQDNNSGSAMSKKEIEAFNLKHIVDAPENSNHPKIVTEKERQKSLKKRCKKLRLRMMSRGAEFEASLSNKLQIADSEHKAKLQKLVKDVNKYLQSQDTGPWPQNKVSALDRALGEMSRILEKKNVADQNNFRVLGGLACVSRVLIVIEDATPAMPSVIPPKSLSLACDVYRLACKGNFDSCRYTLFSNKIGVLVDHLIHRLSIMIPSERAVRSDSCTLPYDSVAASLMSVLTVVLSCLAKHNPASNSSEASLERMSATSDTMACRSNDIISYIISVGVIDKLKWYFSTVRGPVDGDKNAQEFLQCSLGLLVAMTKFTSKRNSNIFDKKKLDDPTQLIMTFEVTDLVGIVSLLYGMLLHSGAPSRGESAPPELSAQTLAIAISGLRMLNHMAVLDLSMLQRALGEEGMSLEFRHIASYLIWYSGHHLYEDLLHEVILCVGYFTVMHPDNQVVLQSGQPPTVLQQLCSLPFQYFSDPRLTTVLFPTLITCCYNNHSNRHILEQELSCELLANFIEEKQLEQQQAKLAPSTVKKNKDARESDTRMSLVYRFPQEQWVAAEQYFKVAL